MKDESGDTGLITANHVFGFDNPPSAGAIATSGWSICQNKTIALGDSTIFYSCLSGQYNNIFDVRQGKQCTQVFISILDLEPSTSSTSATASATSNVTVTAAAARSKASQPLQFNPQATASSSSTAVASSGSSLSTGAKAGIGLGAAAGAILLLVVFLLLVLMIKKRKAKRKSAHEGGFTPREKLDEWHGAGHLDGVPVSELEGTGVSVKRVNELHGAPRGAIAYQELLSNANDNH